MSPRRLKLRKGLSTLYLPYYDALCALLPDPWDPYSGLRTFAEQEALWAQGRTTAGAIVTNSGAGQSAHNWGCASDWTLWQDSKTPLWLHKEDPRWDEYVAAVEKVGLRPGKEFGDIDHNELLISCDWRHVLAVFSQNGMTAAQQKIEEATRS